MMLRSITILAVIAVACAGLGVVAGSHEAKAAVVIVPYFTPIADCGTVTTVGSWLPPGGECIVWEADSGGVYLVGGIDSYDVGDRVFVDGLICDTCLTTCFAGAILNATLSTPCPGGGGGDK